MESTIAHSHAIKVAEIQNFQQTVFASLRGTVPLEHIAFAVPPVTIALTAAYAGDDETPGFEITYHGHRWTVEVPRLRRTISGDSLPRLLRQLLITH